MLARQQRGEMCALLHEEYEPTRLRQIVAQRSEQVHAIMRPVRHQIGNATNNAFPYRL